MKSKQPMSIRQRERLDLLGVLYQGDESQEEAALLIRSETRNQLTNWDRPLRIPETALAVGSDLDVDSGKQWLP